MKKRYFLPFRQSQKTSLPPGGEGRGEGEGAIQDFVGNPTKSTLKARGGAWKG